MKGRIVFPVRDRAGVVLAYAGRSVKADDEVKYRFPSGFQKGRELFGVERLVADEGAVSAVRAGGIVLVEGFTDVLRLWQNGIKNVVGLMGTDFHEVQREHLLDPNLNPTRRVTLFLDNDDAGRRATREIARQLVTGCWVRIVDYTRVPKGALVEAPAEPEHFTADELTLLLGPRS